MFLKVSGAACITGATKRGYQKKMSKNFAYNQKIVGPSVFLEVCGIEKLSLPGLSQVFVNFLSDSTETSQKENFCISESFQCRIILCMRAVSRLSLKILGPVGTKKFPRRNLFVSACAGRTLHLHAFRICRGKQSEKFKEHISTGK